MSNAPELQPHRQDASAFLMGGSVPSASFLKLGAACTGIISEPPTVQQQRDMTSGQPKCWDDSSPMMQLVVTLQTDEHDANIEDDDGRRRIYVKYNMKNAIAEAVRKVNQKSLEVGGKLRVTYVRDGEPTKRGFNPPKFYEASYTPPAAQFLDDESPLWVFAEAIAAVKAAGLSQDQLLAKLKALGRTTWNQQRDTPIIRAWITQMRPESGITDEEVLSAINGEEDLPPF